MSNRSVSHHVRRADSGTLREVLARIAPAGTYILGGSRSTSLFEPGAGVLESAELSRQAGAPVLSVLFDDDLGCHLRVASDGQVAGELSIGPEPPGEEDRKFLEDLALRGIIARTAPARLLAKWSAPDRRAWVREHGVEGVLGLPLRKDAREMLPPRTPPPPVRPASRPKTPDSRPPPARAKAPTPQQARVIELHAHYVAHLFSMNVWTLFNRYKKALPAGRRQEVEELIGLAAEGADPGRIRHRVAALLLDVWEADDWDALIRDPQLVDTDDAKEIARWQALLARTPRS